MINAVTLAIIGGMFGGMLVHMGFPLTTWEYWVMLGLLFLATIIS